jgi:hypothetical protein
MTNLLLSALLAITVGQSALGQGSGLLPIWPVFSRADDGPNFIVECRNASPAEITSGDLGLELRIDGSQPDTGFNGLIGAVAGSGAVRSFPPKARWRVLVGLRGTGLGMRVAPFDAVVSVARSVVLSPGRHVIEIRCAGIWSEPMTFYWDQR